MTLPTKRNRGFTLAELVITLTLVAIMASIALLSADTHRGESTESIGRIVAADLSLARSVAIESGAPWTVKFDFTDNSYQFLYSGPSTPPKISHPLHPGTPLHGYRVKLDRLIDNGLSQITTRLGSMHLRSTRSNIDTITFNPMGGTGPSTHQDSLLMLTSGSGRNQNRCELTVSWLTGQTWINLDAAPEIQTVKSAKGTRDHSGRGSRSGRPNRWGG